jgi:hypothetical protein
MHDDHSPHRHVHTLVLVQGARLNREDFQALRHEATERALSQRRMRDRIRGYQLGNYRSRTNLTSLVSANPPYGDSQGGLALTRATLVRSATIIKPYQPQRPVIAVQPVVYIFAGSETQVYPSHREGR